MSDAKRIIAVDKMPVLEAFARILIEEMGLGDKIFLEVTDNPAVFVEKVGRGHFDYAFIDLCWCNDNFARRDNPKYAPKGFELVEYAREHGVDTLVVLGDKYAVYHPLHGSQVFDESLAKPLGGTHCVRDLKNILELENA